MNKNYFVFDANVLISAVLFDGSKPQQAFNKAQDMGILLLSEMIISELETVLSRSKFDRYLSLNERQEFLKNLIDSSLLIQPKYKINECRDPKDNKYLELAFSGQAKCIVTGDDDLLILHPFRNIPIIKVQDFLNT